MGEMIVNLERRSLLVRSQDPRNRRALKLTLTDEGDAVMRQCNAAMKTVEAEMFATLSPQQVADLRSNLMSLHVNLGMAGE